jgi:HNH endonuclease
MKSFICAICDKPFPESLKHEHHKIPKSLGGPDTPDNIAKLCSADHMHLHAVAYMLVNPKRRHEVDPTVLSIFPNDPAAIRRLLEFANLVAKEMFLKKDIRKPQNAEMRTIVELPSRYLELIRLAGIDQPHKNGRPAGVSLVIRRILCEALCRRYPRHRDEIIRLLPKPKGEPESGD